MKKRHKFWLGYAAATTLLIFILPPVGFIMLGMVMMYAILRAI